MVAPIKLLFVVNHAGFFLSHRLPIALAARDAGYEVAVATPASRHVPLIQSYGLQWYSIRLHRSKTNPLREFFSIVDVVRLYRKTRPSLVHHITMKPVLYGTIAARLSGVPSVVNALAGLGGFHTHSAVLRAAISAGFRLALRHPRMRVIFQNDEDRELFLSKRWCRVSESVLIRGSGVDVSEFEPKMRPADVLPTITLAARMLYAKGVADLVEAAGILVTRGVALRLVLIGEPDPDNPGSISEGQLERWGTLPYVEYLGRRSDVAVLLHETTIACLPTKYGEGVPKFLIEAAATGLPLVVTDVAGCREIVREGENGFLVPPGDVGQLADALMKLLGDAELCERFGRASRAMAVSEFSLDKVIEETLQVYRQVIR